MNRIKILVRKNLKMSDNKIAAQAVHAALGLPNPDPMMSVVVLQVSDAKFQEAQQAHPHAYVVHDAGYTEVPPGTATCLAFYEPDPRKEDPMTQLEKAAWKPEEPGAEHARPGLNDPFTATPEPPKKAEEPSDEEK